MVGFVWGSIIGLVCGNIGRMPLPFFLQTGQRFLLIFLLQSRLAKWTLKAEILGT